MTSTVFVDKRAQRGIWDQWRIWEIATLDPDVETEMIRFYDWLKEARPHLLDWNLEDDDRPWTSGRSFTNGSATTSARTRACSLCR